MSLPLQAFLSSFSNSALNPFEHGDEFSLLKLENLLKDYKFPPATGFNPDSYKLNYQAVSADADTIKGSLDFSRKVAGTNIQYAFSIHRLIPKTFVYKVHGSLMAANNDFPSVVSWEGQSMISPVDSEKPYLNSEKKIMGKVTGKNVVLKENGKESKLTLSSGNLTWKWGMIDMVRIMASKNIQSLEFSTLDEMDVIYPKQKVSFRKSKMLTTGEGEKVNFKVFDLIGDGVIPTVYWVDQFGRVVFIVTGLEAYMLMKSA